MPSPLFISFGLNLKHSTPRTNPTNHSARSKDRTPVHGFSNPWCLSEYKTKQKPQQHLNQMFLNKASNFVSLTTVLKNHNTFPKKRSLVNTNTLICIWIKPKSSISSITIGKYWVWSTRRERVKVPSSVDRASPWPRPWSYSLVPLARVSSSRAPVAVSWSGRVVEPILAADNTVCRHSSGRR